MAIIRKGLPRDGYTKFDNKVFLTHGLSDGAKVLYGYMASMRTGDDFSDTFFMKGLQLSEKTLYRRKKELTEAGLIHVDRVGLKNYILYIGYTDVSARAVKANWDYVRGKNQLGITMQELVARTNKEKEEMPEVTDTYQEADEPEKKEDDSTPITGENAFD